METILITGGAGFIGSHVVRHFVTSYPSRYRILNLDKLTYSGNLENLWDLKDEPNYLFRRGDILDARLVGEIFREFEVSGVIHLAAESHVDRSIENPLAFLETNVLGTLNLLQAARDAWGFSFEGHIFHHVSTDEVYGSLGETGVFREDTAYSPRSPYAASKAGADHLVRSFFHTYGLPIKITNCSNNYGSHQFPEKLIPLCIWRALKEEPIPVYGQGLNIRDWLFVGDHVSALDLVYHQGEIGESYNIGGDSEARNIDLVEQLCDLVDELLERPQGRSRKLIRFVEDRPGHDFRYAVDFSKLKKRLAWQPQVPLRQGLRQTVAWYLENLPWLERVQSGAYRNAEASL